MKKLSRFSWLVIVVTILAISIMSDKSIADQPAEGEEALFTTPTSPDALLLLDLSGSMAWNPAGGTKTFGSSTTCTADTTNCSGTNCAGGYCSSSKTNCSTDCSRLAIAKRAIFDILNDNGGTKIDSSDEGTLNIRFGYMRFYDCSSSSEEQSGTYSYTSGCNQIAGSGNSRRYINSKYSQIFCGSNSSCTNTITTSSNCSSVYCEQASGRTPLAAALKEAKMYLDNHKAADTYKNCRSKYVILITDGSDTSICSGDGSECQSDQYKRRRESVAQAKALGDAGYKVFVIGFGSSMPSYLQNSLNWMAFYGQTDNPSVNNPDNPSAGYPIVTGCDIKDSSTASLCCTTANQAACYPSGVSACSVAASPETATCYDDTGSHSISNFKTSTNDPGYANLTGYAFMATSATELSNALKITINIIRQANYSFSQASIQANRTEDENYLYEGSFEPRSSDPFWYGHLKKYQIDANGDVANTAMWDAADKLLTTSAAVRTIYTTRWDGTNTVLRLFKNNGTYLITPTELGVATDSDRDAIVGYVRGEWSTNSTYDYNPEKTVVGGNTVTYKLGDVFRSNPITIGTPSSFFSDSRDANKEFINHRESHERTSANGKRIIVSGANAGQLHAFYTSNGTEAWSFVPPNLMTKLQLITHKSHPTALEHQYFVDGPVTASDVWFGTGTGLAKDPNSWKTVLVFAEGRGGSGYNWSSSKACNTGITNVYDESHPYYCGYHAFNVTDTLSPLYLWPISFDATDRPNQAPYFGDPWSKIKIGRVRVLEGSVETEKWVGFIGGGYDASDCKGGSGCGSGGQRGKGFFVIDMQTGKVLWSFTNGDTTTNTTHTDMDYSLPGSPLVLDTDNDSFIDTAYIGDMGGNMWRFTFCKEADMPSCGPSGKAKNWTGGLFFDSSTGTIRPIYTSPTAAYDTAGNLWIYWGTGDKTDPTAPNAQEHFYAVKDNPPRTATYKISDIQNITADNKTFTPDSRYAGWRIQFTGQGEKFLSDPFVFGGVAYFTTFTPSHGASADPCDESGTAKLWGVYYTTGKGAMNGERFMDLGAGMGTVTPSVSPEGNAAIYGGTSTSTGGSHYEKVWEPTGTGSQTNMIYWRDRRVQ